MAAEKRFRRLGIQVTAGKIIAEPNLSFWTNLFEAHHYKLLQGQPIKILRLERGCTDIFIDYTLFFVKIICVTYKYHATSRLRY